MADKKKDLWDADDYQHSAGFVPKLATKIVAWADIQPDDVVLDIGCGDGILDVDFAHILSKGSGSLHGIDNSEAMIASVRQKFEAIPGDKWKFEVLNANKLADSPHLQTGTFTKVFSNAAMHWILADRAAHEAFFTGVRAALRPGGVFAFEMGGFGNVAELVAALTMALARRVGLARAAAAVPWFFPDEAWMRDVLERRVGGWEVLALEREYRPTPADKGGLDGWVRLMGREFFEVLPAGAEREACIREVVEVAQVVCRNPGGDGETMGYVRLRCKARKL